MRVQMYDVIKLGLFTGLCAGTAVSEEVKVSLGAHAFLDYENVEVAGDNEVDGVDLRLFRVDVKGSYGNYNFSSNVDFAGDDIKVKDLFVEIKGDTTVRVGNFKVPNGLEQSSSLYSTTFMEGSSIAKINGISRSLGVAAYKKHGSLTFSGGVFGPDANVTSDQDLLSVSGRATYSAEPAGEDSVLHLGVSSRYRKTGADDAPFSFSQKPYAASASKTIKTPSISESDVFTGVEGAFVKGGLSFQTEYGLTSVNCHDASCDDDPTMSAYYLDASYMWGGHRNYKNGVFKRDFVENPVGKGGRGAFAVSARYDVADLSDGFTQGGKQDTYVAGATWYRDNFFRVMLNYSHSEFKDSPVYGDDSADSILLRAQIEIF